jgi:hypothetical protein
MSVESEIIRLQTAKANLKTSIEDKGVTVPSSTKLDGYADLVDSIETGGGSAPYIVNPLNGASFGSPTQVGSITYQYQISGETLVDCGVGVIEFTGRWYGNSTIFPIKEQLTNNCTISITNSGLLTLKLTRSQSAVNEYEWLTNEPIIVTFHLSNGTILADYLYPYCNYSCFIKDTNIILANKTNKKIQDITYGDKLLVWNFDDGKYDSAKPLWIKKTETTTWYYNLKFSNGLELNVTGTYPEAHSLFSVEDGKFIHANKLVGKKVYTLDGIATLDSCEEVHENVEFYNIITNYHMNLFANSVLTSTSLNNLYPIKNMVFVKEGREPTFDYSMFDRKWVNGLRLSEQPKDVTDYCNNLIRLQLKN